MFLLLLLFLLIRMGAYRVLRGIESSTGLCSYFDDLSYGSPYFRIFDFILGMLIYNLYNAYRECAAFKSSFWEVLVIVTFVFYYILRDIVGLPSSMQVFFDAALPVLLILIFSFQQGVVSNYLSCNLWVKLGKMTMFIFFFHYIAVLYVKALMSSIEIVLTPLQIVFVSLFLIAIITYLIMLLWGLVAKYFSYK